MIGVKNNKPTCLSVLCHCMPVEHDALQIETSLYRLRSLVRTVQASTTVGGSYSLLALPFWVETNGALFSGQNIYFYGAYTWALIGTKRSLRQRFFRRRDAACTCSNRNGNGNGDGTRLHGTLRRFHLVRRIGFETFLLCAGKRKELFCEPQKW